MLPGGVLAITSSDYDGRGIMKFVAARSDSDPQALAACRASSLAARLFEWPAGLALTNDGLLVCNAYPSRSPTALYKFAKDGSMDALATVPALAVYDRGFTRCAVHQQTQRTYAIGEDEEENHVLVLLDANLQVVATVEDTGGAPEDDDNEPLRDVAVHGDQVIVLTSDHHPKGSGLRLLDLDGQLLRTIAAGQFQNPQAVAASRGRAFVVDNDNEPGKVLHVIDIQSGDIIQRVRVYPLIGDVTAALVDGNEIFIADHQADRVVVLQFPGSEV